MPPRGLKSPKRKRHGQSHTHHTVHRVLGLFRENPNRPHTTNRITSQRNNHPRNKKYDKKTWETKTRIRCIVEGGELVFAV